MAQQFIIAVHPPPGLCDFGTYPRPRCLGALGANGRTRCRATLTINEMRKEIRRRRSTMNKLKGWRYAFILSTVAAGGVALAFRRFRGRLGKTGFAASAVAGLGGFLVAAQRWELKQISSEEILKAFFPGPAAELFARLPAAIDLLQGRVGSDELYIEEKVAGFAMLRRLIDLSSSRKPYSEARALLEKSKITTEVSAEQLTEGLQLLPFAEVTYEEHRTSSESLPAGWNATHKLEGESDGATVIPYFLFQTLGRNPACLLIVQGMLVAFGFYLMVHFVIACAAQRSSKFISSHFTRLADEAPQKPLTAFASEVPVGSLEDSFRGLTLSQRKFVKGVMIDSHRLRTKGIEEQQKSAAWKFVELVSVSITPIFISIMGNFGDAFRQPIQLLAIALSLVSTICQLSPVGRGEVMLSYSAKLEELCWKYWSVTGPFDELRSERMQKEMEQEAAKAAKAQGYWELLHKRLREDRANILKRVKVLQQDGDSDESIIAKRTVAFGEVEVEEVDSYLDSPLTPLECMRAMLFPNFVFLVSEEIEAGESELQKTFSAPRFITGSRKDQGHRRSTIQEPVVNRPETAGK